MTAISKRRNDVAKKRWLGTAIALLLLAIVPLVGLYSRWFSESAPDTAMVGSLSMTSDRYAGSIIVSTPNQTDCRQYKWDNTTGKMTDGGTANCNATINANGGETRLNAIADGFRNR